MSSMGNNTIEEVSNISSGPKLFQLYVHKDRSISDDLIDRSRRSGFDAMCLTGRYFSCRVIEKKIIEQDLLLHQSLL
jgi:isopentenyl diphosphate isomerase/L-lactate dehydrogenase-like FMN-dependent dehydrogenase